MSICFQFGNVVFDFILFVVSGDYIMFLDFIGKCVIVYFYFVVMMFGCIIQVVDFIVYLDEFEEVGYKVLGIFFDFVVKL